MIDFATIISPINTDEFFSAYWEKKPLVITRDDPGYYRELLSLDDVDYIVSSTDLQYPAFRLTKKGEPASVRDYTRSYKSGTHSYSGAADVDRMYSEFHGGTTIILQGLHCRWPPLAEFCRHLERLFGHTCQTNIYLTPPSSQGFELHADTHDVFILQTEGSKHWFIYEASTPLLLPRVEYEIPDLTDKQPLHEVDLKSGDMIYIPRGFPHRAATEDCVSLHITLGVIVKSWADVFARAVETLRNDEAFGGSLPVGFIDGGNSTWQVIESQFAKLLARFNEKVDLRAIIEQISDDFVLARRPLLRGNLVDALRTDEINIDTRVGKPPTVISRLRQAEDGVELVFHGKIVKFPSFAMQALRFIANTEDFEIGEIPGNLDESENLVLVRRLVREGFLLIH